MLVDAIAAASATPPDAASLAGIASLGAPPLGFTATLLSARIGLMSLLDGIGFVHHELRRRVPFPESLGPELAVWDGQSVPEWRDGVLESPKYFSFFLDTALPAYNPNHRSKWRPHEALHGLVSFFWRPDMTRFEAYVSARISELLPVTHWYGYDEIFRMRCPKHIGRLLYRDTCPACDRLTQPYWQAPLDHPKLQAQSIAAAERAAHYLTTELAAIAEEIATGRRVVTHHPRLDGSSDAEGYLLGHYNRITAWSFGATVEHFLVAGEDYAETVSGLRDRLVSVHDRLLSAPLALDTAGAMRRRMRRQLRDLGYRTFVALEWLEEGSAAEDTLMPAIEAAAELSADLLSPGSDPADGHALIADWLARFASCADQFPPEVAAPFAGLAHPGWPDDRFISAGLPQLMEGLGSALPNHTPAEAVVTTFARSPAFQAEGTLRARYGPWCGDDLAWFNGWLHDLPHRDKDAELFAVLPDDDEPVLPSSVRLNQTLRRQAFPAAVVAAVLDEDAAGPDFQQEDGTVEVAAVWWEGGPRIVPLDDETRAALDAIAAGEVLAADALAPLLAATVAVYLPSCRLA